MVIKDQNLPNISIWVTWRFSLVVGTLHIQNFELFSMENLLSTVWVTLGEWAIVLILTVSDHPPSSDPVTYG